MSFIVQPPLVQRPPWDVAFLEHNGEVGGGLTQGGPEEGIGSAISWP